MRAIDPGDLSRTEQRTLQREPSFDQLAEQLVAREFKTASDIVDSEWYDLRTEAGAKYEVKSTSSEIRSGKGRFRVFEGQTRSLIRSDAQASAFYAFVLFHEGDGVLRIVRRKPSTVLELVNERGGWNRSGHESMGRQHKLPWDEVF